MNRRHVISCITAAAAAIFATSGLAQTKPAASKSAAAATAAAQTIKIAYVDPQSGPFAGVGANLLKHFQFSADWSTPNNWLDPGVKFEMVAFDNKASPQETLTALKQVIDQGIRYVVQGQGSGAALALIDAIDKHNERNPNQSILFLNYAAVDPDLTNSKCSFWHFRFDANTDMKMEALTAYIKDRPEVKNVFLINQNYSHGHQVSRVAKELLARKRPDIKVVGDDLHPLGQVRDFAPYIAKMRAANADTVITGNWGPDLALLVRAAREAGLECQLLYVLRWRDRHTDGGRARQARTGCGWLAYWHPNITPELSRRAAVSGFQEALRRRVLRGCDLRFVDNAGRCDQAHEIDRSIAGRVCDGGSQARRGQWRHRDARGRSSAAAAAMGRLVDQGRRREQARHREDRLHMEDGGRISDLCRLAAHQLRHEAASVAVGSSPI